MAHRARRWDPRVPAFEIAAIEVLSSAGRPLSLRELTDEILARELIHPSGKTPEKSLYAVMFRANRRAASRRLPLPFPSKRDENGRVVYHVAANIKRSKR